MMPQLNRRFVPRELRGLRTIERRNDDGGDQLPKIAGTAAVYFDTADRAGTQYQLWNDVFERIQPGAFDEAVTRDDVRALQNHDPRLLLGRSNANTLSLRLESHGLDYEIDTPDTQAGRDTVVALNRGDMTGSSFQFRAMTGGVEWTEETTDDGVTIYIRNVTAVELFDVGPVTFPAYTGTNAGVRGKRSPCLFLTDQRSEDCAEVVQLRTELSEFIRRNYHEPAAEERERRLRMLAL